MRTLVVATDQGRPLRRAGPMNGQESYVSTSSPLGQRHVIEFCGATSVDKGSSSSALRVLVDLSMSRCRHPASQECHRLAFPTQRTCDQVDTVTRLSWSTVTAVELSNIAARRANQRL